MGRTLSVTNRQKAVMKHLREHIAECGYDVSAVADGYRRNEHDTLLAHTRNYQKFLIIRPTPRGLLSVLSFSQRSQYREASAIVAQVQKRHPKLVRWIGGRLSRKGGKRFWERYFPPPLHQFADMTIGRHP